MFVVKVQAVDCIVAFRLCGIFFNAYDALGGIKRHHAITLWVLHMVGKHTGAGAALIGALQLLCQVLTIRNVVAQHQCTGLPANKVASNDEGLGQTVGAGLHRELNVNVPLAAAAQQLVKALRVLRRADEQHVFDAIVNERGQQVGDQGLSYFCMSCILTGHMTG